MIMAAATVQAQIGTGASVSWASAESGIKWNLADSATATTPISIPTATGTVFSWIKNLVLAVTGTGTTTINNRRISMASSPATGLNLHWKDVAVSSYAQASSSNRPASSGSNGAVPSGYTQMTTSPALWDNTSVATSSTGPNGDMVVVTLGIDYGFLGGPGSATSIPNITIAYDEA
jgi:hypothetical protein